MPVKFTSILVLAILLLNIEPPVKAQEQIMAIDTSGYMPLPEGLDYNLAIAASKGYAFEIHRLIKLGADPEAIDDNGATPLIYAVANEQLNAVKALLSYDPDIDIFTFSGESPLHITSMYDMVEIGELLIRKGADINIRDNTGCTPLHYSAIYNYLYYTDMLIYYNADVNLMSSDGTTPLLAAAWAGNAEICDLLLQSGANPDRDDYDSFTPLMAASQNGDTLVADLLLKNGADIYRENRYSYNSLAVAIRSDQSVMVDFLLKRMDREKLATTKETDPFSVARSYGRKDIMTLLENYGLKGDVKTKFDKVSVSASTLFNIHDIYVGGVIEMSDPYHNINIHAGFNMKPGYTRVLVKEDDNSFTQYLDKRYVVYVGAGKEFNLREDYIRGNFSLKVDLDAGYMFSNRYKGTYESPGNYFRLMPSAVIKWSKKPVSLFLGYEYMKTGLYRAGPNWIKAGGSISFFLNRSRAPLKDIKWY